MKKVVKLCSLLADCFLVQSSAWPQDYEISDIQRELLDCLQLNSMIYVLMDSGDVDFEDRGLNRSTDVKKDYYQAANKLFKQVETNTQSGELSEVEDMYFSQRIRIGVNRLHPGLNAVDGYQTHYHYKKATSAYPIDENVLREILEEAKACRPAEAIS